MDYGMFFFHSLLSSDRCPIGCFTPKRDLLRQEDLLSSILLTVVFAAIDICSVKALKMILLEGLKLESVG